MNIEQVLKQAIHKALLKNNVSFPIEQIVIERSRDEKHGDYATNIAMQLASVLKKSPRDIATMLVNDINDKAIAKKEIAGPGFINFTITQDYLTNIIPKIIELGDDFGQLEPENPLKINVEFVSANPTGELHLGHARGAAIGDSLCRILAKAGHEVTREYYVNDAGVQIDNLAKSVFARYQTLLGNPMDVPEDGYHSEHIIDVAQQLIDEAGNKYTKLDKDTLEYFKKRSVEIELKQIKYDLVDFNVNFDVFTFETDIRTTDTMSKLLSDLSKFTYVEEDATLLKTSEFGDDKDRVIVKSNGDYTYFLPDIAYHLDKFSRNYDLLIDVLGADHHGYINRMKAAMQMFGYKENQLHVEIIQMVRLLEDGKEIKMSKRTGMQLRFMSYVAKSALMRLDISLLLALQARTWILILI